MTNKTTAAPTTSYLLPTTTPAPNGVLEPVVSTPKELTTDDLRVIGWVLWVLILMTLAGNFCSIYAVFDRRNFKKMMTLDNPFLLSNILCAALSFVDVCQVISVGIPAAISYTTNCQLEETFYNKAVVDPLLDMVVWTQLFLIVAICLDRAGHICWPVTYDLKPFMMVLAVIMCPAFPFFTLTLPYIFAAEQTMELSLDMGRDKLANFICLSAKHYENGSLSYSPRVFMGCALQLGDNWKYTKSYQTWENVSSPLILLLTVASLTVTTSVILFMLRKSAQFQKNNVQRQRRVAKGIRTTCAISIFQAFLILASSLPLRWYQIYDRLFANCDDGDSCHSGFSHLFKIVARVLVFLSPIFNPWLYAFRMSNVRTFLSAKKTKFMRSAGKLHRNVGHVGVRLGNSRGATSSKMTSQGPDSEFRACKTTSLGPESEFHSVSLQKSPAVPRKAAFEPATSPIPAENCVSESTPLKQPSQVTFQAESTI